MEATLAREIKTFRKQFRSEYGRDPSKRDIERHPDVAASYSKWLAIKSDKASSSSSSSSKPSRAADNSTASVSHRRGKYGDENDAGAQKPSASSSNDVGMAPPPTTPRRNKVIKDMSMVRTPKRNDSAPPDVEMDSAIHDSGGSVRSLIDVPTTPQQPQQPKRRRHGRSLSADDDDDDQDMTTPSPGALSGQRKRQTMFDNANSPSKLRSLIASFGVNMGKLTTGNNSHNIGAGLRRTPTKGEARRSGIEEEDERLKRSLQISKTAVAQNGNLFTPRTKARKRLRGELVVTPSKSSERGGTTGVVKLAAAAMTPTKTAAVRPVKRQRGMGTLKDFGIVTIAGPQAKTMAQSQIKAPAARGNTTLDEDDDDDNDDDDLIGPSPSARRVVIMPMPAFRPLFDDVAAHPTPSSSQQSNAATATMLEDDGDVDTDTALTTPAVQEEAIDSDEEDRRMVRAYQRYEPTPRRSANDDFDEDEEHVLGGGLAAFAGAREEEIDVRAVASASRGRRGDGDDDDGDEGSLLRSLSIASPQCKRARRRQRLMAAQSVRRLLHGDGAVEVEDVQDEGEQVDGDTGAAGTLAKTKAGVTVHGHGKTARMMRGTLTKTARRNLAAAELADEQRALAESAESTGSTALPGLGAKGQSAKASMILRRGRDDDGDDDDDEQDDSEAFDLRSHHSHASAAEEADDDDWASDVDSVDYGLGDGYMDDADVL